MQNRGKGYKMKLKKCPCGRTPKNIERIEGSTFNYAFAYGDCCNQ